VVKYGESMFVSMTQLTGKQTIYRCFGLFPIIHATFLLTLLVVCQNQSSY